MRLTPSVLILACMLLGASHPGVAGQTRSGATKYGVTVTATQPAQLAKARTYQWTPKLPAFSKTANDLIVAAVDRELGARGLTKVTSGRSDTVVSYASVTRTDVDVKSKPSQDGSLREFRVGSIVLDLRDGAGAQSLFRVRMDTPIESDPAALETTINAAIAAMFEKYPAAKP